MGKTSERLKDYQTQMSIYAEQHKMILASDVRDMIEQLQDDLKDDTDKVVAEIRKQPFGNYGVQEEGEIIDIVRKGGVE